VSENPRDSSYVTIMIADLDVEDDVKSVLQTLLAVEKQNLHNNSRSYKDKYKSVLREWCPEGLSG